MGINNMVDLATVTDLNRVNSNERKKIIKLEVKIADKQHLMELDTVWYQSILAEDFWKQHLAEPVLQKSSYVFRTYTKAVFRPLGELQTTIAYNGQKISHCIPIRKGTSLFGRDLLKIFQIDWNNVQLQLQSVTKEVNVEVSKEELLAAYQEENKFTSDIESTVNFTMNEQLEVLPVTTTALRKASVRDITLSRVYKFVQVGWPKQLSKDDKELQPYFNHREELTITQYNNVGYPSRFRFMPKPLRIQVKNYWPLDT
ncbi:unnamed protein product [Orchesella dallaii]|uniref:Uncharacterized protein n=1 Tax=Orchesella dallaii TaxID=48710 RepID=A0ABP1Q5C2_9HEXA